MGRHRMNECNDDGWGELAALCNSDSLSLVALRETINRNRLKPNTDPGLHCDDLILLMVCQNELMDAEIVKYLLDCFPNSASTNITDVGSPLLAACSNKSVTAEIIKLLITAAPEQVLNVCNVRSESHTPLDYLCGNKINDDVISEDILKLLLEECNGSTFQINGALHVAAAFKSPQFCSMLIAAFPGSERSRNFEGLLPIHLACVKNTLPTVKCLYKLYPDAINQELEEGSGSAIHFTVASTVAREDPMASVDIVKFLLGCNPTANSQVSGEISILRCACGIDYNESNIGAGIENTKIIYDAYPELIDDDAFLSAIDSFHPHLRTFVEEQMVYSLQAKDSHVMTTPDTSGQLPLHHAVQNNARLGSINLLISANPLALRITTDVNSAIPLQLACKHHYSPRVVQHLIDLDPTTLRHSDRDGNTALHYACSGAKYQTITMLLERYDASSVCQMNKDGNLPIDLLFQNDLVEDGDCVEYITCVYRLLRSHPLTLIQSERIS